LIYALGLRIVIVTRKNFSRPVLGNEIRIVFIELMNDIKILPKAISPLKAKVFTEGKI
jgi:hypothetical protein